MPWSGHKGRCELTKVKVVLGVGTRFPSEVSTTADESAVADPESTVENSPHETEDSSDLSVTKAQEATKTAEHETLLRLAHQRTCDEASMKL